MFCVRIANHPTPWFRFVAADRVTWQPLDRVDGSPWIDDDTLTCLIAADPGESNRDTQVLSDAAQQQVFAAWERARAHVHSAWSELTDWANLEPQIDRALRDAIHLVSENGDHLGYEEQGDLIARLNGKWERAIVRSVRDILRRDDLTNREKVTSLRAFVTDTGLPIPERAQPLRWVRIEDVRVVCWMAVTPAVAQATTIAEQLGELPLGDKL